MTKDNATGAKRKALAADPDVDALYSLSEAAKMLGLKPQALRIAQKNNRLIAGKINGKWFTTQDYIWEYAASRYDKAHHFKADECSVAQAAQIIGMSSQHVYYLLREKKLPYTCKAKRIYCIKKADLEPHMCRWSTENYV